MELVYLSTAAGPRLLTLLIALLLSTAVAPAQNFAPDLSDSTSSPSSQRLRYAAYGVVNYYAFDWETQPDRRNAIDVERLNTYLWYDITPKIEFKAEIEFEHGGTAAALSFDPIEEFGTFEQEIEKGGAVILEQMNLTYSFTEHLRLRAGKMRFYMGNASKQDQPREYFTAYRSEVENTLLPLGWYESGLELSGELMLRPQQVYPHVAYKLYLVSGLDNTAFTSLNWIRRGYQRRFETINADNLAYAGRIDYIFGKDSELGFNLYAGNASANRPKDDVAFDSWVTYGDAHFAWEGWPWRARAYAMYGNISNSEALSAANRNLSNNLEVKRTPVAKAAAGAYLEGAYDVLAFSQRRRAQQLYLFGRAEYYDSMYETVGEISDNPRFERRVLTAGINWFVAPTVVIKAHQAWRTLGSGETENTFAAGLGFDF